MPRLISPRKPCWFDKSKPIFFYSILILYPMSYEELLTQIALEDDRFVVMTAENRALVRKMPETLKNRFIDTGITEQTMVGAAAGLALRGRIPVIHALSTFLTMRAFEFIRTDIGIPGLPVKLSSYIPGFLSDGNGPTHQAIEDISLMRGIPNMTVYAPADEDDLLKMVPSIWKNPEPAYIRINTRKTDYKHTPYNPGKSEIISVGKKATILVYGLLFEEAFRAREILLKKGLDIGLVNMRCLKPLDQETLVQVIKDSEWIIPIEDHFHTGGLYSILAEFLLNKNLYPRVLPINLGEKWFTPGLLPQVLENEGFSAARLAERIEAHLA